MKIYIDKFGTTYEYYDYTHYNSYIQKNHNQMSPYLHYEDLMELFSKNVNSIKFIGFKDATWKSSHTHVYFEYDNMVYEHSISNIKTKFADHRYKPGRICRTLEQIINESIYIFKKYDKFNFHSSASFNGARTIINYTIEGRERIFSIPFNSLIKDFKGGSPCYSYEEVENISIKKLNEHNLRFISISKFNGVFSCIEYEQPTQKGKKYVDFNILIYNEWKGNLPNITNEEVNNRISEKMKKLNINEYEIVEYNSTRSMVEYTVDDISYTTSYDKIMHPTWKGNPRYTKERIIKLSKKYCKGKKFQFNKIIGNVKGINTIIELELENGMFIYPKFIQLKGGSDFNTSTDGKILTEIIYPLFDNYITQKRFENCRNPETGYLLPYDLYVPEFNLLLEKDGVQHYNPTAYFNKTYESYLKLRERDEFKNKYAISNGYNFMRIADYEDHEKILKSFLKLIEENPGKQIVQIYGEVQII